VAQHLIKTVAAARLMGADCIISGIRPQIAQTIVHLGLELGVISKATMADAFALARKALHLGADAYLRKPIDHPRLLDILDRLSGNRSTTRVLLVDDEEVTRYLVRQLLPRGVYDLREATSGTEGLAQLLSDRPDVVLLDLKMPEMTGFELLDRISDETSLDGIPSIVLTSAILTLDERQRLQRAARIMSKSDLSGSALTGAITDALNKSPSEAA
jgi:CheY-like chemotaxis protein